MNITINVIEVASELAEEIVCAKFEDDESLIYQETEDGTCYTEDAQELFNEWYDHYFNFLIDRQQN
jgi:hypothetical protein